MTTAYERAALHVLECSEPQELIRSAKICGTYVHTRAVQVDNCPLAAHIFQREDPKARGAIVFTCMPPKTSLTKRQHCYSPFDELLYEQVVDQVVRFDTLALASAALASETLGVSARLVRERKFFELDVCLEDPDGVGDSKYSWVRDIPAHQMFGLTIGARAVIELNSLRKAIYDAIIARADCIMEAEDVHDAPSGTASSDLPTAVAALGDFVGLSHPDPLAGPAPSAVLDQALVVGGGEDTQQRIDAAVASARALHPGIPILLLPSDSSEARCIEVLAEREPANLYILSNGTAVDPDAALPWLPAYRNVPCPREAHNTHSHILASAAVRDFHQASFPGTVMLWLGEAAFDPGALVSCGRNIYVGSYRSTPPIAQQVQLLPIAGPRAHPHLLYWLISSRAAAHRRSQTAVTVVPSERPDCWRLAADDATYSQLKGLGFRRTDEPNAASALIPPDRKASEATDGAGDHTAGQLLLSASVIRASQLGVCRGIDRLRAYDPGNEQRGLEARPTLQWADVLREARGIAPEPLPDPRVGQEIATEAGSCWPDEILSRVPGLYQTAQAWYDLMALECRYETDAGPCESGFGHASAGKLFTYPLSKIRDAHALRFSAASKAARALSLQSMPVLLDGPLCALLLAALAYRRRHGLQLHTWELQGMLYFLSHGCTISERCKWVASWVLASPRLVDTPRSGTVMGGREREAAKRLMRAAQSCNVDIGQEIADEPPPSSGTHGHAPRGGRQRRGAGRGHHQADARPPPPYRPAPEAGPSRPGVQAGAQTQAVTLPNPTIPQARGGPSANAWMGMF